MNRQKSSAPTRAHEGKTGDDPAPSRASRWLLIAAAVALGAWIVTLTVLALAT